MKKCLIVVDMQNDFIEGSLGFDGASSVIKPIQDKISHIRKQGGEIIFTQDTHDQSYLDSVEGNHLPVKHCIEGTVGHNIHPDIDTLRHDDDKIFVKDTFPSLALGNYLEEKAYESIEICGLVSNICVLSNAVIAKAALPNTKIVVDAKATKSFDPSLNDQSLNIMESLHIEIKNRS